MDAKLQLFTARTSKRITDKKFSIDSDLDNIQIFSYQFKIFAILWAIATLFHLANSSVFDSELNYALLTLAAFVVVIKPSLPSFLILILLQVFDAIYRMPITTNHWIFTTFVNISILHVLLYLILKNRSFFIKDGDLIKAFGPVIRVEVIILYFFTAFHKLNSGFFNTDTSCATDLLLSQDIAWLVPVTPNILSANAYAVVILEFLIPTFLCFRKTRNVAIIAGVFFHGVLAYNTHNAFYDFSSMIFAAYFLFCPPSFSERIVIAFDRFRSSFSDRLKQFTVPKLLIFITVIIALIAVIYFLNKDLTSPKTVHLCFFWSVFFILYLTTFIWIVREGEKGYASNGFSFGHASFIIMPVIVFLNGFSPYLGLKTENSFSMFSNLRTEGGTSNHYIMPSTLQIFNYQKDVVEILSSTDPTLQKLADHEQLMVLSDFRNYVIRKKPAEVHYRLNGEDMTFLMDDKNYLAMKSENSYLVSKFMGFRLFNKWEPQPCRH